MALRLHSIGYWLWDTPEGTTWLRARIARLILFTPLGDVEWVVNLHCRWTMGEWPKS